MANEPQLGPAQMSRQASWDPQPQGGSSNGERSSRFSNDADRPSNGAERSVSSSYRSAEADRRLDAESSSMELDHDLLQAENEDYVALRERYEELQAKNAEYLRDLELASRRIDALRDEMDLLLDAMQLVLPSQSSLMRSFPSSPPVGRRPPDQPNSDGGFPVIPAPYQIGAGSDTNQNGAHRMTPPMVISIPAAPQETPNGRA